MTYKEIIEQAKTDLLNIKNTLRNYMTIPNGTPTNEITTYINNSGLTANKISNCNYLFDKTYSNRISEFSTVKDLITKQGITGIKNMFYNCTELITMPDDWTLSNSITTGDNAFYGCSGLTNLPSGFTAPNMTSVINMFYGCSSLINIPSGFTTGILTSFSGMLSGCINLQSVPNGINFAPVSTTRPYNSLFDGLKNITSIPSSLSLTCGNEYTGSINVGRMFYNCEKLVSVPTVHLLNSANGVYANLLFYGCKKLEEIVDFYVASFHFDTSYQTQNSAQDIFPVGTSVSPCALRRLTFAPGCHNRFYNINIAYCSMSHDALVEMFNSLPTKNSGDSWGKNLVITGNPGVSTLTDTEKAIATNKYWTLVL